MLQDVEGRHQKAKKLFQDAALGNIKLFTSVIIIFEIYWVLSSFYNHKKTKIADILTDILKMNFIKLEERKYLKKAIAIFIKTNLDLEDSYNLIYAQEKKAKDFATFDKKLKDKFVLDTKDKM